MKTFIVEIREVHISSREVKAEDHNDAVARVENGEGVEVDLEYSDTKHKSTWSVSERGGMATYYFDPATGKHDKRL
jgi:hypothetical protein